MAYPLMEQKDPSPWQLPVEGHVGDSMAYHGRVLRPAEGSVTEAQLLGDTPYFRTKAKGDLKELLQGMPSPDTVPLPAFFCSMTAGRTPESDGKGQAQQAVHALSDGSTCHDEGAELSSGESSGRTWPWVQSDSCGLNGNSSFHTDPSVLSSNVGEAETCSFATSKAFGEAETCVSASNRAFADLFLPSGASVAGAAAFYGDNAAYGGHAPRPTVYASSREAFGGITNQTDGGAWTDGHSGMSPFQTVMTHSTKQQFDVQKQVRWEDVQKQAHWEPQQQSLLARTAPMLPCWAAAGESDGAACPVPASVMDWKPQFCIHCGSARIQQLQRYCTTCGAKSF